MAGSEAALAALTRCLAIAPEIRGDLELIIEHVHADSAALDLPIRENTEGGSDNHKDAEIESVAAAATIFDGDRTKGRSSEFSRKSESDNRYSFREDNGPDGDDATGLAHVSADAEGGDGTDKITVNKWLQSSVRWQVAIGAALLLVGLVWETTLMGWSWQFSLYHGMVTALTVGYGDDVSCRRQRSPDPTTYTAKEWLEVELNGSAINDTATGSGSGGGGVCRDIMDNPRDMVFCMLFSFAGVTIINSLFIEYLERLEKNERRLFSQIQHRLLETYQRTYGPLPAASDVTERKFRPEWSGLGWRAKARQLAQRMFNAIEYYASIRDLSIWIALVILGVLFYSERYNASFVESLYWVIITGLAVGYGDTHPKHGDNVGYIFTFIYAFVLVIYTFRIVSTLIKRFRRPNTFQQVLFSTFSDKMLRIFDRDGDGTVSRDEYLGGVLTMLGYTELETVDLILKYYSVLDLDGDGVLTIDDLRLARERGLDHINHFEQARVIVEEERRSKRKSSFVMSQSNYVRSNDLNLNATAVNAPTPPFPTASRTPLDAGPSTASAESSQRRSPGTSSKAWWKPDHSTSLDAHGYLASFVASMYSRAKTVWPTGCYSTQSP